MNNESPPRKPVSSMPPAMPGETALTYEQLTAFQARPELRPIANCRRPNTGVQTHALTQRQQEVLEELHTIQEPLTNSRVANGLGWTLNVARYWMGEFARRGFLRVTKRGHFWQTPVTAHVKAAGQK